MQFDEQRAAMVQDQLVRRGISDPRVLAAMQQVPREEFLPAEVRDLAYQDGALPIGYDQTISQPYTVAFMCEAARLHRGDRVLEVGTGCGYGAAVLAQLAERVDTIERIEELAAMARDNLQAAGVENVAVHWNDGTLGLSERAPFDAIVVTAGAVALPTAYGHQLAEGGRIVIPIGPPHQGQTMYRFTRQGDRLKAENLGGFAFVPLVGQGPTLPLGPASDD